MPVARLPWKTILRTIARVSTVRFFRCSTGRRKALVALQRFPVRWFIWKYALPALSPLIRWLSMPWSRSAATACWSSPGSQWRGAVPFIGRMTMLRPRRQKKSSGEAETIVFLPVSIRAEKEAGWLWQSAS